MILRRPACKISSPIARCRSMKSLPLAFACLLACLPALAQSPHTAEHRFSGAERWARVFDDPARDAWQKPHQVIEALALAPDAVVADIGSGTGYFAARLAHFVPKGRVYGGGPQPHKVQELPQPARA